MQCHQNYSCPPVVLSDFLYSPGLICCYLLFECQLPWFLQSVQKVSSWTYLRGNIQGPHVMDPMILVQYNLLISVQEVSFQNWQKLIYMYFTYFQMSAAVSFITNSVLVVIFYVIRLYYIWQWQCRMWTANYNYR